LNVNNPVKTLTNCSDFLPILLRRRRDQADKEGSLIVCGFDNGVLRVLKLCRITRKDAYGHKEHLGPGDLTLVTATKPHTGRITCLAVDSACQLLATAVRPRRNLRPCHTNTNSK